MKGRRGAQGVEGQWITAPDVESIAVLRKDMEGAWDEVLAQDAVEDASFGPSGLAYVARPSFP